MKPPAYLQLEASCSASVSSGTTIDTSVAQGQESGHSEHINQSTDRSHQKGDDIVDSNIVQLRIAVHKTRAPRFSSPITREDFVLNIEGHKNRHPTRGSCAHFSERKASNKLVVRLQRSPAFSCDMQASDMMAHILCTRIGGGPSSIASQRIDDRTSSIPALRLRSHAFLFHFFGLIKWNIFHGKEDP
ncbi:hypothetical protein KC19_5G115500 [Ceratodon purpureus]|uniref:Uncharacterized protein n=1 Tax=Ceratodon purpureus TaxID=3225 RepID=A0A8T0I2V2_CERPU|nr:hypothetical protein KC19_5G115500 [Ceratodon purpureus]